MSFSSEDYVDRYETDGDNEFRITFPVHLDSGQNAKDIKIYYSHEGGSPEEITADCSISGITVITPEFYPLTIPASEVIITRYPEFIQGTRYKHGGTPPNNVIESDFDRVYFCLQALKGELSRCFKAPLTELGELELSFPKAADRASNPIGFNADGSKLIPIALAATGVSTWAATLVDDESASAALTTLGLSAFFKTLVTSSNAAALRTLIDSYSKSEIDEAISAAAPMGIPHFWPWTYASIPSGFVALLGQTLSRTTYATLWALAELNTGSDRFHFGVGDGSTTFILPDWTGVTQRGSVYVEVETEDWDATNDRIDMGYSDLPNGTPIIANATAGGLSAGTTYYLALDPAGSGTEYFVYDTEAHANANDGSTGLVDLSAITSSIVLTGVGEYQGKTLWSHVHPSIKAGSGLRLVGSIIGDSDYGTETGKTVSPSDVTNYLAVTDTPLSDLVHETPELSNESRMANIQGIWIIKAN